MTLKTLAETKYSSIVQAAANSETVDIYTVPAAKSALVKEIIAHVVKIPAGDSLHLYILKSAGVDLPANGNQTWDLIDAGAAPGADVVAESPPAGFTAIGVNILARTSILSTGDKLRLRYAAGAARAVDLTRAKLLVTGDEF